MKVIRQLNSPTLGLVDYCSQEQGQTTYDRFQEYDGGRAHKDLLSALIEAQHGLCGYCEVNLLEGDSQVEHFVPRSAEEEGRRRSVDHSNMIACCKGGDQANLFGPKTINPDPERYILPTKDSRSCGSIKAARTDPELIDPRTLAAFPSPFKVQIDGNIIPDETGCADLGLAVSHVEGTIKILGLDVRRLKANRADKWKNLEEIWGKELTEPDRAKLAARAELMPNAANQLPKYFTTSRSYFGAAGEVVLDSEPKSWI